MTECTSCLDTVDCLTDDLDLYSLQSPLFHSILRCPPGFDCDGSELRMNCCDQELVATYPPNATEEERNLITQALIADCSRRLIFCGDIPPPPPIYFLNRPQIGIAYCGETPFTYTVPAGRFAMPTQEEADREAKALAESLAKDHRICLSDLTDNCRSDGAYRTVIKASGKYLAKPPYTDFWSLTGSLPTGLLFHGGPLSNGRVVIDGTPTNAGIYTFTVKIVLGTPAVQGDFMRKTYTIEVLPFGEVGTEYSNEPLMSSVNLTSAPCPNNPVKWKTSGTLPNGLTLAESGAIIGTPTTEQACAFSVRIESVT